jgi:hypothetical protein
MRRFLPPYTHEARQSPGFVVLAGLHRTRSIPLRVDAYVMRSIRERNVHRAVASLRIIDPVL